MTNTITAETLRTLLLENECIVEFTKVNGEVRSMPCTLKAEVIPDPIPAPNFLHFTNTDNPIDFPVLKKEKKVNPDVMSVWCLDKKEWRSFRVDNVVDLQIN